MKSWISRLLWKVFREQWLNKKTKVQGKVIDPYSYIRGFEDGMNAMSTPINIPMLTIPDKEFIELREKWIRTISSPIIKTGYSSFSNEDKK